MCALHVGARLAASHAPRRRKFSPPRSKKSLEYITNNQLAVYFQEEGKGNLPTSKIELTISCKNLLTTHIIRKKSNPYCVVSMKRAWQLKYKEIARTETIENCLGPEWLKKIVVDYNFEIIQQIRFEVRDDDLNGHLGRYDTTLSELIASAYLSQTVGKLNGEIEGVEYCDAGEIVIVTEEATSCKRLAEIQFRAENLPKLSWFSSIKPFLLISRSNEDGSYSAVVKTEPVQGTQNPMWKPFSIDIASLCHADFDRCFKIDCYNHRDNGSHKLIGSCYASLSNLHSMSQNDEPRSFVNEEKQKRKADCESNGSGGGGGCGMLKVEQVKIIDEVTFLDFIRNGTQMHFAVAIDYTASNGVHTDPKSLHYLCEDKMNHYELALHSIGDIICQYDHSQIFPAFGFGAKLPPNGQVSFHFPLNGNESHPYCSGGVEEILAHYRNQLNVVELYGPTNFAPVIHNTITISQEYQDGKHYFILLIITDGVISDMRLTKRAIIEASKMPISIIIVGVGDDNFEAMNELDSDGIRLTDGEHFAERDIVQFVPLNNFLSKSGSRIKSQADLAEEVLAEIPDQLTSYMIWRGFQPKDPVVPDSSAIVPTAPMHTNPEN